MSEIDSGTKVKIIQNQIQVWRNTEYDASVRHRVGKALKDEQMMQAATLDIERAVKAVDLLENELESLYKEGGK